MLVFNDTETLGLVGECKLIQYSTSLDPKHVIYISMFRGWQDDEKVCNEIRCFLDLLEDPNNTYVGFNITFDLFQLYRIKHQLMGWDWKSRDNVVEPFKCQFLDLQMHSMFKSILSPFAFSKKAGNSIARMKKVPASVAEYVSDFVTKKLKKHVAKISPYGIDVKPHIHEVKDDPKLKDLSWTTNASLRLKSIMKAYGVVDTQSLEEADWWTPSNFKAMAEKTGRKDLLERLKNGEFELSEKQHVPYGEGVLYDILNELNEETLRDKDSSFWKYAEDDIIYLVDLYEKLGKPKPNQNDYCGDCVAYTRYHGFPIDFEALEKCLADYKKDMDDYDLEADPNSPKQVLKLLQEEYPVLKSSAKKTLEKLANGCDCEVAKKVLAYRKSFQRYNQAIKLLESETKRGHPEFRVIGTATNRMAGTGGFNWQGISKPEKGKTTLRDCILTSSGGDMSQLEVVLAAIIYQDDVLLNDIRSGMDLHTLNTVTLHAKFKGMEYGEAISIRKDKAHPQHDLFEKSRTEIKAVTFGVLYGAEAPKIAETLEISEPEAKELVDAFYEKYYGVRQFKDKVEMLFCTGDTTTWNKNSVEGMQSKINDALGHTRSWTLEKAVADLFWRASDEKFLPAWTNEEKIVRQEKKGEQTVANAVRSSMLGAALTIQKSVARQAINSMVQSVGAQLTKRLQVKVYRENLIPIMQVHDELQIPKGYEDRFEASSKSCENFVEEYGKQFENLGFKLERTERWSDK